MNKNALLKLAIASIMPAFALQPLAYGKASDFLSKTTEGESFESLVKKSGLKKQTASDVLPTQGDLSGLENPRELVRWAYRAEVGDVSDQVFEMGDKFVVARLSEVKEKGILPLAQLKKQIEPLVIKDVKAKRLKEKLEQALSGTSNINQVAQKVGKPATVIQNIVLANPVLPGIGQENALVGAIFGSQPGKLSKVVKGENSVFVFVLNGFVTPEPLVNTFKQKQQVAQYIQQRSSSDAFKALKEGADIKDNRVKFF